MVPLVCPESLWAKMPIEFVPVALIGPPVSIVISPL